MRTWRTPATAVAALALVAAVAGCGQEAAPTRYTAAQLDTALLAPADLGGDFEVDDRTGGESRPPDTPAIDPGIWCPAAGAMADEMQRLIGAEPVFVQLVSTTVTGRKFHGVSEEMWAADDAAAVVEAVGRGLADCAGAEWSVDDGGTARLVPLSAGDVGDDMAAALVTYLTEGPDTGYAWRNRIGVVRVGTTVIVLQELDVQPADSSPVLTDEQWREVVSTAVQRVEALADA